MPKYEVTIRITAGTKKDAVYWLRQYAHNIEDRHWTDGHSEGGTLGVSWSIKTGPKED